MKYMEIIPDSTLFLGGTKELNSNKWVSSGSFPLPDVFYGAIASKFLSENLLLLKSEGLPKNNRVIEIGRIFIKKGNKFLYIPAPFDILENKGNYKIIKMEEELEFYKNYEYREETLLLYEDIYSTYESSAENLGCLNKDEYFKYTYKVGIELENKIAKDKQLYRIDQLELQEDVSYVVEFQIHGKYNGIPESGFLKLGGENKISRYKILNEVYYNENLEYEKTEIEDKEYKVKIICLSPAALNRKEISGEKNDIEYKLEFVNTKKPIISKNYDAVLRAGTVLYYEIKDKNKKIGTIKELKKFFRSTVFKSKFKNYISNKIIRDGFSEIEIILL